MRSVRSFGLEWYAHSEVRRFLPQDLLLSQDKEFAELLSQMLQEGGLPIAAARYATDNSTSPATLAISAIVLAADTAANPTLAETVTMPTTVLPPASTATASPTNTATTVTHTGGKPIKVEAAPLIFSRIDVNTDIEDWLEQVRENCVFGQVDQSQWVVYASGFLGVEPKSQWLARKREARLTGNATEIMQWDTFVDWCRKTFVIHNRTQMAYRSLQNLEQTTTVVKYVSRFNVLSLQANMTEEQKIWAWYEGLKPDIRNKTEWDPVTKQRMATLQDAQSAAIAVDGFYMNSGTAGNAPGAATAAGAHSGLTSGARKRSFSASEPMEVDARRQRTSLPANGNLNLPSGCLIPLEVGPVWSASDVLWRRASCVFASREGSLACA